MWKKCTEETIIEAKAGPGSLGVRKLMAMCLGTLWGRGKERQGQAGVGGALDPLPKGCKGGDFRGGPGGDLNH